MTFLFTFSFFLLVAGLFLIFNLSPIELLNHLTALSSNRKLTLKKRIKLSTKPKRIRGIRKIIKDAKETLKFENQNSRFPKLVMASILLSIVGVLLASTFDNFFLVPVLAVGFALLPFLYVLLLSTRHRKRLNTALETALSTITSSYLRTESIITAVAENVDQLDPLIKPTFERFLVQSEMISSDLPALLESMKNGIDSDVFHEWIDAVILCQDNRTLKSTLIPIVNKLSDMRVVSGDLNNLMYEPLKEFTVMASLLLVEVPFLRSQNEEWYNIMVTTPVGKIIITLDAVILLISLVAVIRNIRPIEYRR